MASPTARSSAPRVPCPPGVDPVPGPQSPRSLSSDSHSPALARASEPRRPPDAVLGRPATRIREQGEAAPGKSRPPPPGPADRSRLKFAGRSPPKPTRCRRGRRPGAPLPRRRQTNNFHIGCGQRENPIGSSPSDRRSDPQGRRSCQTCFFHSWEFGLKLGLCVIDTR